MDREGGGSEVVRRAVAQFPPPGRTTNPYGELLYAALAERGIPRVYLPGPACRSLGRSGTRCHSYTSTSLGYQIVWTVHDVRARRWSGIDRADRTVLARASSVLLVHNDAIAQRLRAELGRQLRIDVIPARDLRGRLHARSVCRRDPGGAGDLARGLRVPVLCFGQMRADKQVGMLLDAFASVAALSTVRSRLRVASPRRRFIWPPVDGAVDRPLTHERQGQPIPIRSRRDPGISRGFARRNLNRPSGAIM